MQGTLMTLLYNRSSALPQKVLPDSVGKHGPSRYLQSPHPRSQSLTLNLALLSRLPATRRSYNIDILFEYLSSSYPRKKIYN